MPGWGCARAGLQAALRSKTKSRNARGVNFINMIKRSVSKRPRRQRRGAFLILCSTFQFF